MNSQIKQLTRQTLVYGAGNVLTRFVTFLLLPLFTNLLTPQEYGLVTLVYVFLGFMNIIYNYGLGAAFMRHYSETGNEAEKNQLFSTAVWLILGTSGILSLSIFGLARPLSNLLLGNSSYYFLFTLAAGILFFDALTHIPFAFLRMKEKAGIFISIKLLNVLLTFGLNIYFVAILNRGIEGIFTSAFIASVITAIAVFMTTLVFLKVTFSIQLARAYLKFGLPFVPAGLASIAMEMIDRYILLILKDTATVGIYSAGYKLGIFMLLLTTAFNYAWQPFFLKMGKRDGSRSLFATVFSYYVVISMSIWIIISTFIPEIIRLHISGYSLIGSEYYGAESIVPIILLAYVFQGAYLNFLPGIYFEKKSYIIPIVTAAGALVNIGLNIILIPAYDIMGAAIATLAGYVTMSCLTYFISKKMFPINYEWGRIVKIALSALVSFLFISFFGETVVLKLIGILIFFAGIIFLNVLAPGEKRKVSSPFQKKPRILFFSTLSTPFIDIDRQIVKQIGEVRSITSSGLTAIAKLKWFILFSDVLIAWFASTYSSLLVFLARLLRKKSIVIVGGADVNVNDELEYGQLTSRWKLWPVRYSLRKASYVLPMSQHLAARVKEVGDYDGNNIRQITPGLDADFWKPGKEKESVILTVALCSTETRFRIKGIDILINTARLLPDIPFLIIGLNRDLLTSMQFDLPPNVTVKPPLKENELLLHYQKAKIVCQPSRIESLSFSLAQGMLCECIPVATNVGGIPEVIGNTGFLVPPEDSEALALALTKAVNSPIDRGKDARNTIQSRFSLKKRAESLNRIIIE